MFPTRCSVMLASTFGFSEGMQRCHWNRSASCLWHSCPFWSPLKHRAALCPLWWGGGVANMGLCFRLAWRPNNTRSPTDWNRMLRVEDLFFFFLDESSLISTNLWVQTGVFANLLKSPQAAWSWKTQAKLIVFTVVHHICSCDLAESVDVWSVLLVRYYMLSWGW